MKFISYCLLLVALLLTLLVFPITEKSNGNGFKKFYELYFTTFPKKSVVLAN